MGMNTYVYGLKAPTERYLAMKAVRDNCSTLMIEEPPEVEAFLDRAYGSDESGERVDLPPEIVNDYNEDMESRFEVDVTKLPPEVIKIRFVNSY